MGVEPREEAERAWANLAARESSLLFLDQYVGIERIALLAGFAPRGLTGFTPAQRAVGQLLRDAEPAIPAKSLRQLEECGEKTLAGLKHGEDGKVVALGDPAVCGDSAAGTPSEDSERPSTAADWWPFFFRSVQGRLCEVLVPALVAGHANSDAQLEQRSACLRAACGVLWTLEQVHYGPVQAPLLARSLIEALALSPADEHAPLVADVLTGCDADRLLVGLRPPPGEAAAWRFSSDYRTCLWGAARFAFTETQSRIIRALHEERAQSGCGLGLDALRQRAELEKHRAGGVSQGGVIRNAFRKKSGMHPCWDQMLRKSGRDVFELVPPPVD